MADEERANFSCEDKESTSRSPTIKSSAIELATGSNLPLEFITLTERPASQTADFSHTIRSHAMLAFLKEKKNPKPAKQSKKRQPLPKIQSADQLSGKFKLSTWSRKSARKRLSSLKEENSSLSDWAETAFPDSELISVDKSNAYGTLPIFISQSTQRLLYHYNTCFTVNAFAANFDNRWKPFSISDSALLHATLCLVAQHEDLLRGTEESSTNLYHKGQAMKVINQRLLDDPQNLTDASVTSIALFAIVETINGSFEAASAHQVGLMKLISLRGGFCCFKDNFPMLRILTWSDIIYSMRWGSRLKFPILNQMEGSLAENLSLSFDFYRPPTIFQHLEINDILDTLQTISYAIEVPNISVEDKKVISDAIYNTEHKLLTMEQTQTQWEPQGHQGLSSLSYAFTIAAILYLEVIIREHLFISKAHCRLVSKLHILLMENDSAWYGFDTLPYRDLILWIMFVKVLSSPLDLWSQISTAIQFAAGLESAEWSKDLLRQRLTRIAWRKRICDSHLDRILRGKIVDSPSYGDRLNIKNNRFLPRSY